MLRYFIINGICFGSVCGILAYSGLTFVTWQFWAILLLLAVIQINSSLIED